MLWTALGIDTNNKQFIFTFYGSHDSKKAIYEAIIKFKNVKILGIVAGDHTNSSYVNI